MYHNYLYGNFFYKNVFYNPIVFDIFCHIGSFLFLPNILLFIYFFHNYKISKFLLIYKVYIFQDDIIMDKDADNKHLFFFRIIYHMNVGLYLFRVMDFYIFRKNNNIMALLMHTNIYIEDNSN